MSYRTRLRRDLDHWQDIGLIDSGQRERIVAEALGAPGLTYLNGALVLCAVIVASTAVIAFVAANWYGMGPVTRMAVLFLMDAATLAGAYAAARHKVQHPGATSRVFADGAATLSLAVAAATLALVAQTFHLPSDPRGFAQTVALLGLVTAIVARSGGAALIASVALITADSPLIDLAATISQGGAHGGAISLFWLIGFGLCLGCISNWLPAKASILFILLVGLAHHLGAAFAGGAWFIVRPERVLTIAVVALGIGNAFASWPAGKWSDGFRNGGEALVRAAAGLCLVGFLLVSASTMNWFGRILEPSVGAPIAAIAVSGALIILAWRRARDREVLADLLVLGAAALSLTVVLAVWSSTQSIAHRWGPAPHLPPFWTVWGGIAPCLMLVVAGHIEDRRALFGWALTAVAGLTLGMLVSANDLLGFSLNLLETAFLISMAIVLCRWVDRRTVARPA